MRLTPGEVSRAKIAPKGVGRAGWLLLVAALLLSLTACGPKAALLNTPAIIPNPAPGPIGMPEYFLYIPPNVAEQGPARLVLALHGIGGNGNDFAKAFLPQAQAHHWVLVAPTFKYGDWKNPASVRAEDVTLDRHLQVLLDDAMARVGAPVRKHIFVVGFSRGAQLADRFALFHPDMVAAVASLSAGTYTVPERTADIDGDGKMDDLPLPYGTSDMSRWVGHALDTDTLRRVTFLVCVGGEDTNPSDVPRQWDPLLGKTRVARAQAFERSLQELRIPAQLAIYPGDKHQLTAAMAAGVDAFLSKL